MSAIPGSFKLIVNRADASQYRPRTAEFFAGIGLVRLALEGVGCEVVWANDIEPSKHALYAANFDDDDFRLDDIRNVRGVELPDIDLATASFPCTDLSLAGNRRGLRGEQSGMFWEFARVLEEMDDRRPSTVMLENVPSFATSHEGEDLRAAVARLNELGYVCDLFVVNAAHFVAQSRARLFIVGSMKRFDTAASCEASELRPGWVTAFIERRPELLTQSLPLRLPTRRVATLADVVERLRTDDSRWWSAERVERFRASLSPVQSVRLSGLESRPGKRWSTAYRRTRLGSAVWEIRRDHISGCLRTARGGSSKQAIVEAGNGRSRVRWMTPREYARLQGVPDDYALDVVTANQALFGLGDAVCVPVIEWIGAECLWPALLGSFDQEDELAAVA